MKRFFLAVSLVLMCSLVMAGQRLHVVQPKGTGLKLTRITNEEGSEADFKGQIWITGTFVAYWSMGVGNKNFKTPDYLIVPDTDSISQLPYFILKDPPYFNTYKVKVIDLNNGEPALNMVAGEEKANKLLAREIDKIKVVGKFLIDTYSVGVECDYPWAKANLVKFEIPDHVAAVRKVPEGC